MRRAKVGVVSSDIDAVAFRVLNPSSECLWWWGVAHHRRFPPRCPLSFCVSVFYHPPIRRLALFISKVVAKGG